jgi:Rad3-related DNA helicase
VAQQVNDRRRKEQEEKKRKEAELRDIVAAQTNLLEQKAQHHAHAAAARRQQLQAASGYDDEEFLLDSNVDALTGRAPTLSPAQELRLASLLEQQDSESELLHATDTPLAVKVQLIWKRVNRGEEIRKLNLGQSGGGGKSKAGSGEDEVGDLLSRILHSSKPKRKPQIIFASRTHSQLVQLVGEVRKLKYGKDAAEEKKKAIAAKQAAAAMNSHSTTQSHSSTAVNPHLHANTYDPLLSAKVISLGSRLNLCTRPEFSAMRAKKEGARLNDACLDLQKEKAKAVAGKTDKSTTAQAGCEYLSPDALSIFHDHALSRIHDLEELEAKGKSLKACAYYGSRAAAAEADVLLVPYPSLLSQTTREALGIELEDSLLIVDEAHNLHDTINEIYSAQLSFRQLQLGRAAVRKYYERFHTRLSPVNKANVETVLKVCDAFYIAFVHAHAEAHRQAVETIEAQRKAAENGAAFAQQYNAGVGSVRELNDIFGDGGSAGGISLRDQELQAARVEVRQRGTVVTLLEEAAKKLQAASSASPSSTSSSFSRRCSYSLMKSLTHFNASLALSDMNYLFLASWMQTSELCRKVKGYVEKVAEGEAEQEVKMREKYGKSATASAASQFGTRSTTYHSTSISPLSPLLDFLLALSNIEGDGRICVQIQVDGVASQVHGESCFRFLMLNPSIHLVPLMKQARTIILAGGTMQPFDTFRYQLFPVIPEPKVSSLTSVVPTTMKAASAFDAVFGGGSKALTPSSVLTSILTPSIPRLHFFSCVHVLPPSHIQSIILLSGPGGKAKERPFEFVQRLRGEKARMDDLALTLVNMLRVIPAGVVVFFTSYAYANQVLEYWATHASAERRVYADERAAAAAGMKAAAAAAAASLTPNGNNFSRTSSLAGAPPSRTPSFTPSTPTPSLSISSQPLTWLERLRSRKSIFRDSQTASFEETLEGYTRVVREWEEREEGRVPVKTPSTSQGNRAASPTTVVPAASPSSSSPASPPSFTDFHLQASQTGALLFSIINGKMSEGINFSDNLARAVIVVGLPYPNVHDAEMREKCLWAERERNRREATDQARERSEARKEAASPQLSTKPSSSPRLSAGEELLNTICMRSVNQSIGRAFRHLHDYASILLLDQRYTKPDLLALLPRWLKTDQFRPEGMDFERAFGEVSKFFQEKKLRKLGSGSAGPQHQQLPVPMQISPPTPSTSSSSTSADELARKRKALQEDLSASELERPMKKPDLAGVARA